MVEVFKTNVLQMNDADYLIRLIYTTLPSLQVNFDLDDCDKVLRVAGNEINIANIITMLLNEGFNCEILL